jgi:hypothetical protein
MKERDHLEYAGVVEIMLLKLNFKKKNSSTWAWFSWLITGVSGSVLQHGIEPLDSIEGGEFL